MTNGREPRSEAEWTALSQRFMAEADRVLRTGERQIAYERYGYAAEAAAKALILRRRVLTIWPRAGQPHADEVHTHSIQKLIKYAGAYQAFCLDRQMNQRLHDSWLVVKEWWPDRYTDKPPEHTAVVLLGRAAKYLIEWLDRQ
jgi:HEPN domain-containing protein